MRHSIIDLHPQRILIRSTNWIGDAIITTPAVRTIRRNFPNAKISILALPWVADVFAASPHVDEVILYQKKKEHSGMAGMWKLAGLLAEQRFDLAILLQNAISAAILTKLAGIPARAGYTTDGRALLLTNGVKLRREVKKIHQVNYYQEMLRGLGLVCGSNELFLQLPEPDIAWARAQAGGLGPGPLVGLNPGAAYGPAKRWPAGYFKQLATLLRRELRATMVVFGTGADAEAAREIEQGAPGHVVDLAGKTSLAQAMAMIGVCDVFVTNDSGLMHVSAALGVPTLAIFGSTDHVATGPRGSKTRIIRHETECSPCLKPECPTDFRCMLSIEPEEVWKEMEKFRQAK